MKTISSHPLEGIDFAAQLFLQSKHIVVLTGAGISTPSGIPDFRSEGTGLWARNEPLEVASLATFRTQPEKFFDWFRPLASQIYNAAPNKAHLALAKLQKAGFLKAILTQNVDMLHQKAGSTNVIELHGTMQTLSCIQCFQSFCYENFLPPFIEYGKLPRCPSCNALLKPDVILFGEQLPHQAIAQAQREIRACDLVVVVGSSLEVLPVAGLPLQAVNRGAHLVIVNNSPTYLHVRADVVIQEDVVEIIPSIAEKVLQSIS